MICRFVDGIAGSTILDLNDQVNYFYLDGSEFPMPEVIYSWVENEESKRLASWHLGENTITLKLCIKGSDPQDTYDRLRVLLKRLLKENTLEIRMWGATGSVFYHAHPVTPKLPDYAKKYIIDQSSMTDVTIEIPVDKEVKTSEQTITITSAHVTDGAALKGAFGISVPPEEIEGDVPAKMDVHIGVVSNRFTNLVLGQRKKYSDCFFPVQEPAAGTQVMLATRQSGDYREIVVPANLLPNGTFDVDTTGWDLNNNGTNTTVARDATHGPKGSPCLKIGSTTPTELAVDGCMEDWASASIANQWDITLSNATFTRNVDKHAGTYAARITMTGNGWGDMWPKTANYTPYLSGETYSLSGWVKGAGAYPVFMIQVACFDSVMNFLGTWPGASVWLAAPSTYTKYSASATGAPLSGTAYVGARMWGSGLTGAWVEFDDVSLTARPRFNETPLSPAATIVPANERKVTFKVSRMSAGDYSNMTFKVYAKYYSDAGATALISTVLLTQPVTLTTFSTVTLYQAANAVPPTAIRMRLYIEAAGYFNGLGEPAEGHGWYIDDVSVQEDFPFVQAVFPIESHRGKAFLSVGASFAASTTYDELTLQAMLQTSEGEAITTSIAPQVISLGDPDTKFKETFLLARNKLNIPSHGVSNNADLSGIEELVRLTTDMKNVENLWGDAISLIYYDRAMTEVSDWADKDHLIFDSRSSKSALVSLDGTLNKAQAYDHTKWKGPCDFEADPDGINMTLLAVKDVDGDHQLNPVVTMSLVYNPTYLLVK